MRAIRSSILAAAVLVAGSLVAVSVWMPADAAQCAPVPSDFTGDGRADLAIGEPGSGLTPFPGAVRVLYSAAAGLGQGSLGSDFFASRSAGLPPRTGPDPEQFGTVVASGFFDGDCQADLAIGTLSDEIVVLYGTPTGLETTRSQRWTMADVAPAGEQPGWFGAELAVGDFNGDGRDDLAVGSQGAGNWRGGVGILYGGASGLTGTGASWLTQPGATHPAAAGDRFGGELAVGDFDGDHRADLAVGANRKSINGVNRVGAVQVYRGSPAGLAPAGALWHQARAGVPGAPEAQDGFGDTLAAGDLNGDGRADLAIGATAESIGTRLEAGHVTVLLGSPTGLTVTGAQGWNQDSPGVPGVAETWDRFGAALAFGDLNRDGRDDLMVGAPREGHEPLNQTGTVTVLYGAAAGLTPAGAAIWDQDSPAVPGSNASYHHFGGALHVLRGLDGFDVLAVGAPEGVNAEDEDNNGSVFVLRGSAQGLTGVGSRVWTSQQLTGGVVAGGHLGSALG